MLTATEAREKIEALKVKRIKLDQEVIEFAVNEALKKGESFCRIGFMPCKEAISWVEELGYEVKRFPAVWGETEVRISW